MTDSKPVTPAQGPTSISVNTDRTLRGSIPAIAVAMRQAEEVGGAPIFVNGELLTGSMVADLLEGADVLHHLGSALRKVIPDVCDEIVRRYEQITDADDKWLEAMLRFLRERTCRACGCDDAHACHTVGVPCHWAEEDLCSACAVTDEELAAVCTKACGPGYDCAVDNEGGVPCRLLVLNVRQVDRHGRELVRSL